MSTSPLRAAMVPVSRQIRAYFAPVNRASETPAVFDPSCGMFSLNSPPSPWLDLGWVEDFTRWYETPTDAVRSGAKSQPAVQFRGPLDARVEFSFVEWGKLQMALACGSEHMNVLAPMPGGTAAASGGTPNPGVAILPGSTASELILGAGAGSAFAAGSLLAVDLDYQQQIGYVGSGISAAYVTSAAAVKQIRITSSSDIQCGTCGGSDRKFCVTGSAPTRRRTRIGGRGAGSGGFRGPGGWVVLSGVVCIVCGSRRDRRANLLSLSATQSKPRAGIERSNLERRHNQWGRQ